MRRKKSKRILDMTIGDETYESCYQDFLDTQKEFGILLTSEWDSIYKAPGSHARAVRTAKKIQRVQFLLTTKRILPRTIH